MSEPVSGLKDKNSAVVKLRKKKRGILWSKKHFSKLKLYVTDEEFKLLCIILQMRCVREVFIKMSLTSQRLMSLPDGVC